VPEGNATMNLYPSGPVSRAERLDRVLAELVGQVPEIDAAAVVSFDGLPMASALPAGMDEDRVAAMSAALLSLGERAAEGLGRGLLSQVYVEGENGTVFLVSADDEAVLVAVAVKGAKVGLMLFEVRHAAAAVAEALRTEVTPGLHAVPVAVAEPIDFPLPEQQPYSETPAEAVPVTVEHGWGSTGSDPETNGWS
jgi:predicted regulator of Ras-like GTPase activity (Roadblock/LC7/MglB family)